MGSLPEVRWLGKDWVAYKLELMRFEWKDSMWDDLKLSRSTKDLRGSGKLENA